MPYNRAHFIHKKVKKAQPEQIFYVARLLSLLKVSIEAPILYLI